MQAQPQLEKKLLPRGRAPLTAKAVVVLCAASFAVGLLLSGRVSLLPSASAPGKVKTAASASGCDDDRVSASIKANSACASIYCCALNCVCCLLLTESYRSS
jgi:hypothetical protein